MPLTPADVRNKQFSTTRLRPGYDEEEVDAFLDEVEAELDRLIQENEELRAKLAEVLRGGKTPGRRGPQRAARGVRPGADGAPSRRVSEPERRPEPVMMKPVEDNMDTAARVLALAQQTADQAIADARREADETLGRARREADDMLTKARRQSEQITSDARARAESLERDAQERHRQAMGSLVQSARGARAPGRRPARLRARVPQQAEGVPRGPARDLEAGAADSGVFPASSSGQRGRVPCPWGPHGRTSRRCLVPPGVPEPAAHNGSGFPPDRRRPARPQVGDSPPASPPAPSPPPDTGHCGLASLDSGACQRSGSVPSWRSSSRRSACWSRSDVRQPAGGLPGRRRGGAGPAHADRRRADLAGRDLR